MLIKLEKLSLSTKPVTQECKGGNHRLGRLSWDSLWGGRGMLYDQDVFLGKERDVGVGGYIINSSSFLTPVRCWIQIHTKHQ